jgi:HEAT repeat protein
MTEKLKSAMERLCTRDGDVFDRVVRVLRANRDAALPILVRLLDHPDPAWRIGAASALSQLGRTPPGALDSLIRMLKSPAVTEAVSAIAALDWIAPAQQMQAVPAMIALLGSRPVNLPAFTRARAHLPRSIAAHFLGLHGGAPGFAALSLAAQRPRDPVHDQIAAALDDARTRTTRRRLLLARTVILASADPRPPHRSGILSSRRPR